MIYIQSTPGASAGGSVPLCSEGKCSGVVRGVVDVLVPCLSSHASAINVHLLLTVIMMFP